MKTVLMLAVVLCGACLQATPYVTNVVAKQRYPWNGKVDIDYETYGFGAADVKDVFAKVTAKDLDVGYTYVATNLMGKLECTDGSHHVVWDMAQYGQLPNKNMEFAVWVKTCPMYCVIDVSGGATVASYPVSYLDAVPPGGWTDVYKTEKIVLRRISPGHRLCSPSAWDYETYKRYIAEGKLFWDVWLTDPYYIGIFEVTKRQYELVMGESPEGRGVGDTMPQECVSYVTIRGNPAAFCYLDNAVDGLSFMGKLRAKTGMDFDLPTNYQWENACTAGIEDDFNNGGSTESDLQKIARYYGNSGGDSYSSKKPQKVGSYLANAFGLYDMHGNVWEWTVEAYLVPYDEFHVVSDSGGFQYGMALLDPAARSDYEHSEVFSSRYLRGGSYLSSYYNCTSRSHAHVDITKSSEGNGFRLCWTVR